MTASSSKLHYFCGECGHDAPQQGDWDINDTPDGYELYCPECNTCILNAKTSEPIVA